MRRIEKRAKHFIIERIDGFKNKNKKLFPPRPVRSSLNPVRNVWPFKQPLKFQVTISHSCARWSIHNPNINNTFFFLDRSDFFSVHGPHPVPMIIVISSRIKINIPTPKGLIRLKIDYKKLRLKPLGGHNAKFSRGNDSL